MNSGFAWIPTILSGKHDLNVKMPVTPIVAPVIAMTTVPGGNNRLMASPCSLSDWECFRMYRLEFEMSPIRECVEKNSTSFLARVIREACLRVQGNLETVVKFLLRLRRPGLSRVDHWLWPQPARMAPFITGADKKIIFSLYEVTLEPSRTVQPS